MATSLASRGYETSVYDGPDDLVKVVGSLDPDVILMDSNLRESDERPLCGIVRDHTDAYIVTFTDYDDSDRRLADLVAGADDSLTIDVSAEELVIRVDALLRRPRRTHTEVSSTKREVLHLDPRDRAAVVRGHSVELTPLEYSILETLLNHVGRKVSREEVIHSVWNSSAEFNDHSLDVHVSNIRRKLAKAPDGSPLILDGVRGLGYRVALADD